MTTLVKYEAARAALAAAHRIDEVKDIRDKAVAMQTYARQAKDRELIDMATDIKLRAERRAGELLTKMPKNKGTRGAGDSNVGKATGGRDTRPPVDTALKLSDIGINKDESSRWQKLARMSEQAFEEKLAGVKTSMRAKTEGHPKGSTKPKKQRGTTEKFAKAREIVRPIIEAGEELKPSTLAKKHGISHDTLERAALAEQAVKEALADPVITPDMLSLTAQQKLDAAIRQHKHRLSLEFRQNVLDEVKKRIDEMILPHWKQQIDEAQQLYARRRGLMNKATFNAIRRALHPDSRNSISDRTLAAAFDTFMGLEKFLLNEKDSPTVVGAGLPSSWAEWEAAKQQATAERRAKRQGNRSAVRRA